MSGKKEKSKKRQDKDEDEEDKKEKKPKKETRPVEDVEKDLEEKGVEKLTIDDLKVLLRHHNSTAEKADKQKLTGKKEELVERVKTARGL